MTVLLPETTKLVVGLITDAIKPKVPFIIRTLVKPVVKIGVNKLNELGGKYIPDEVDNYINTAVVEIHKGNYDVAAESIGVAADLLVDIPSLDAEHEKKLFVSIAQAIVNSVKTIIESKKK